MVNWCFLPDHVLEVIFSYLAVHDLRNCSLVCKNWYRCLNDENNDVWRLHCVRKLAEEALKSDLLTSVPTYKAKLRAFYHAWNPNDCSRNIYVKPNGFTLHRNPVAQSTDGARGRLGFRSGRHAWEVVWEGPLGTVAVVGVASSEAAVQCPGYVALLGSDEHSWGWNLVDNHLLHNGDSQGNYPLLNNAPKYQEKPINPVLKAEGLRFTHHGRRVMRDQITTFKILNHHEIDGRHFFERCKYSKKLKRNVMKEVEKYFYGARVVNE